MKQSYASSSEQGENLQRIVWSIQKDEVISLRPLEKCFPRRNTSAKKPFTMQISRLFFFITTRDISNVLLHLNIDPSFPISNLVAASRSRYIGYRLRVTEGGTRLAGSVSRNKTKARELFGCRTISHAVTMGRVEWLYNGNTRHETSLHVDNSTEIGIYHR